MKRMKQVIEWIRTHKLTVVLLVVIGYLVLQRNYFGIQTFGFTERSGLPVSGGGIAMPAPLGMKSAGMAVSDSVPDFSAPAPTEAKDRLVIRDTTLSLQVKSVQKTIGDIEQVAANLGGFLVDSNLTVPEGATSGTISIRVPEAKRGDALSQIKQLAVKTVSESVSGHDVTDEFVDLEARLEVLAKTKVKFEAILEQASRVPDLLEVERELTNLQSQIDSLHGQQKYLEQSAKLTKITAYLSTDELALPYAPDQPWRPSVIFKQAVRSLVGSLRSLGTLLIWLLVYTPVWLTVAVIVWWWKRRRGKQV